MGKVIQVEFQQKKGGFDYEAYRERAQGRYLAAKRRKAVVAAAEAISTLLIGVCTVVCSVVFLTML